ncbi:RICIN domain-containing protein [Streptomyces sp. NPDC001985]|uniref:RICIN domain-containing protein n=1 Tax=Streptomyces sp. NPDC001985 TaxID=3154406 RepID=UPI00332EC4B9
MALLLLPLFLLASVLIAPGTAVATPSAKYGNARYDQWSFVTTHNSYAYDSRITPRARNQGRSINAQLVDGVRGFMLDTYDRSGEIQLCHAHDCADLLRNELRTIVDWLKQNREEVVTIFLENSVSEERLRTEITNLLWDRSAPKLLFDPASFNIYQNNWPTLRQMVDAGQRLVIFRDKEAKNVSVDPNPNDSKNVKGSLLYTWGHAVETQYGYGLMATPYGCRNRAESQPMNTPKVSGNLTPLFILNQFNSDDWFIDGPFNGRKLVQRVEKDCASTGRVPNAIAVDHYHKSDGSGVTPISVAKDLNRKNFIYAHEGIWILNSMKQYENSRYRNRCMVRGAESGTTGGLVTQRGCANPAPNSQQWEASLPTGFDSRNHFWIRTNTGNCLTAPNNGGSHPPSGTQLWWWPCGNSWGVGNQLWSIHPVKVGNGNANGFAFANAWTGKCLTVHNGEAFQNNGRIVEASCPTPTV